MSQMTEIHIIAPRNLRILVPHQLVEELARLVPRNNLGEIITEALAEELKKIRFRQDLNSVSRKMGLPVTPNNSGKCSESLQQVWSL